MADAKIEKCKRRLLDMLLIAEGGDTKKAANYNHYKVLFGAMDDNEFKAFLKEGVMRVKELPLEKTFTLANIAKSYKEVLGRNLEERVTMPFMMNDPEIGAPISDKKQIILRVPVIKLMQTAQGENRHSEDIVMRDKTNQVVNGSKGAGISDNEVAQLLSGGYEKVIEEMFTFRADNDIAKKEAYTNIRNTGRTNIPEAPEDGKVALKYITACYYGMGIEPGFLDKDY